MWISQASVDFEVIKIWHVDGVNKCNQFETFESSNNSSCGNGALFGTRRLVYLRKSCTTIRV